MNNYDFLRKYQKLQYKIMYDQLIDLECGRISYCELDASVYWNFALINKLLSDVEISQIEQTLHKLVRAPAIYFENRNDLNELVATLSEKGYQKGFEDSWMFYKGQDINNSDFDHIKKVKDKHDLQIFLETFNNCYQKDDIKNPYGELGDYLRSAEKVWFEHNATNRLEYFIAYLDNKPVAVGTLTNYKGIGYISNIGSLKEVRGKGFGKLITLYCVSKSQKNSNSVHCLATEVGTYPHEFYNRIGFRTLFTAHCFVKKQK